MLIHVITKAVVKTVAKEALEAFSMALLTAIASEIATKAVEAACAKFDKKP